MPVSTSGFKKIGSFYFLTLGTLFLGTLPPFCEEVQVPNREAYMERNQGAWPSAPTELSANLSQSHESESSWKQSFSPPIRSPQLILCGANMTLPKWLLKIWNLNKYKLFSKYLSWGVSCYTTIKKQNQNQNWPLLIGILTLKFTFLSTYQNADFPTLLITLSIGSLFLHITYTECTMGHIFQKI